ncbi:MAG: Hsp20/alpha crystallin family protein [Desulfonauticus sp.]|nr:Hsp20/alpha crystallin family protein [Desulfonauticus sp.]
MLEKFVPSLRQAENHLTPTKSIFDLFEQMDRMLREAWHGDMEISFAPAIEVRENDEEIIVKAELPGLDKKDIDVRLENNYLILQGEKKKEEKSEKDNIVRMEVSYGTFYRAIPLPAEVDESKIEAKYKKGVLTIKLPKTEKSKSKKIAIES